ncbi:MAG: hypothetical protein E4H37_07430 [Gemmatimonadales bacterium]|nr:MAG: hypothetical protein E4H37_07430 [Gemmatimonadales bacterium]
MPAWLVFLISAAIVAAAGYRSITDACVMHATVPNGINRHYNRHHPALLAAAGPPLAGSSRVDAPAHAGTAPRLLP